MSRSAPIRSFDRLARPYHLLELLTCGPLLRRAREHFLPALHGSRHALVLGDGDGRFLHALLAANPSLHALAVDSSGGMLQRLTLRSRQHQSRLTVLQADLRRPVPLEGQPLFDLVVTHFFLDCLSTAEVHALLHQLRPHLAPGALWLLSDFRVPPRGPLRLPAALLVRGLYLAFRLLTGLRTSRLPDHSAALERAGFRRKEAARLAGGLLTAELWQSKAGQ